MKVNTGIKLLDPVPKELEMKLMSEPLTMMRIQALLDEYNIRWESTGREVESEPEEGVIVEKCNFVGEYHDNL